MTPELFLTYPLREALSLLPAKMDSLESRAMVIAICLQESKLVIRHQVEGPAKGYAQFEQGGGVTGVFTHPATAGLTKIVCAALDVTPTISGIYMAVEQNDTLCAALARLLLWTLPTALVGADKPEAAWQQYVAAWRPGKPHRETWDANFAHAWAVVNAGVLAERATKEAAEIFDAAVELIKGFDRLRAGVVVGLVELPISVSPVRGLPLTPTL